MQRSSTASRAPSKCKAFLRDWKELRLNLALVVISQKWPTALLTWQAWLALVVSGDQVAVSVSQSKPEISTASHPGSSQRERRVRSQFAVLRSEFARHGGSALMMVGGCPMHNNHYLRNVGRVWWEHQVSSVVVHWARLVAFWSR